MAFYRGFSLYKRLTKNRFPVKIAVFRICYMMEKEENSMLKRKYRVTAVLLAVLLTMSFCLGAWAEEGDLLSRIRERGYIVIATEGDWAPWTYHDESNALVGFDVEVGRKLAAYIGVEARFEETGWDAILAGVDSGRFDIAVNGVSVTPARSEKYDFSVPYVYSKTVLVVRGDNESIHSFEDLNGKRTANTISSIFAGLAESYGATVVGVEALADTIQLVLQGRVDATMNSRMTINDFLREHPDANLKIVDERDGDIVAVPVRKGGDSDSLLALINEALASMRADGTLKELSERYFGGMDMTAE